MDAKKEIESEIKDINKDINKDIQDAEEGIKQLRVIEEKIIEDKNELDLDCTDSVAIIGDRNSGKTNLAFYFMNQYKGNKKKYLYGYPIQKEGYILLEDWNDILRLTDSIIFIDELQKHIRLYDRRANEELLELLSLLAQKNNTLLFTTQLSQFITRGIEASIQTWAIKQIDVQSLKNGSKAKRILRSISNPRITNKGMSIDVDEYIIWDNTMPIGFNGIHTFENQNIGKDWKNSDRNSDKKCDKNSEKIKVLI